MQTIAICYWGMTRSINYTYKSHIQKLYTILKNSNINYDIFMHTWKTENNIIWEKDCNVPIDYNEYKLLNPNYYQIDMQQDFLNSIIFEDYFNKKIYEEYGDNPNGEWRPQLILNHLCALESQKRVFNMVIESKNEYDLILYIRPDVEIMNNFDVNWLNIDFDIMIPDYDNFEGLNDRFAILPFKKALKYSTRINEIIEFRKNNGRIVSEKYVKYIVSKYYSNVKTINYIMQIIRPVLINDKNKDKLLGKKQ